MSFLPIPSPLLSLPVFLLRRSSPPLRAHDRARFHTLVGNERARSPSGEKRLSLVCHRTIASLRGHVYVSRSGEKKRKTAIERVRKKQEGERERREEDRRRQRRLARVVRNSAETRETVSWRDNSALRARERGGTCGRKLSATRSARADSMSDATSRGLFK